MAYRLLGGKRAYRLSSLAVTALVGLAAAIGGAWADEPTPAPAKPGRVIRAACKADRQTFCSSVKPGGGRILVCLRENNDKLTPDCREALTHAKPTPAQPQ